MEIIQKTLAACGLFTGLSAAELAEVAAQARFFTRSYTREQVVAFEEDECSAMGIVASGSIHIQRIFPSGRLITLETFRAGDSFGEALIFSDSSVYPATLVAQEDSLVVYIARADVAALCARSPRFLENFMRGLSNRILLLNRKIKDLTVGSVRQKVANYLLAELRRQGDPLLRLDRARHELADALGIPRPSLSRELIAMKEAGWIDFDRKTITILDLPALERVLKQ